MISPSLNPNSRGFSASKSYNAWQHGPRLTGVRAGERTGDGKGDANVLGSIIDKNNEKE